jgi:hypothetical protein
MCVLLGRTAGSEWVHWWRLLRVVCSGVTAGLGGDAAQCRAQGFRTADEVQRFSDMMDEMCYIVATKHSGSLKARGPWPHQGSAGCCTSSDFGVMQIHAAWEGSQ